MRIRPSGLSEANAKRSEDHRNQQQSSHGLYFLSFPTVGPIFRENPGGSARERHTSEPIQFTRSGSAQNSVYGVPGSALAAADPATKFSRTARSRARRQSSFNVRQSCSP